MFRLVRVDEDHPEQETEVDLAFPMIPITEKLVQEWTVTDPYWISHRRTLFQGGKRIAEGPDYFLLRQALESGGKVGGEELSTAGIGALVRQGAATFATLVSQVFNEADAEGDWSEFYETWLAEYFVDPDPTNVPIMTVEDAAALYPSDLE
jgi:hypothetical protein